MRYQAVWMYAKGYHVAEILEINGCSRMSLMNWCRAYREAGPEELEDQPTGSNNAKLNEEHYGKSKSVCALTHHKFCLTLKLQRSPVSSGR